MVILEPTRRPMAGAERDHLRAMRDELAASPAAFARRMGLVLAGVVLVLWLVTLLVSDADAAWVTLFWLGAGILLWLWLRTDLARQAGHARAMAASLDAAIGIGEVDSYDVVSRGYVEFEEVEDEGACWGFDLGDGRVVFVRGQEYYREDGFPSHDFSIVRVLDESGLPVHEFLVKRGGAEPPVRVIPAAWTWSLAEVLPGHLEVLRTDLTRLERDLEGTPRHPA